MVQFFDEVSSVFSMKPADSGVELILSVSPDFPQKISSDPTRVRQILLNLLSNAYKFTENGYIKLIAKTTDDQPDLLYFAVKDTGIGLSLEQQEKLFKSYAQADASTSRKYGGTGLGLAICKHLSELMQGGIGVTSEPNEGATFWFTLKNLATESSPTIKESLSDQALSSTKLILLHPEEELLNSIA